MPWWPPLALAARCKIPCIDTNVYVVIGKDWRTVLAARNETVDEDGNIVPLSQKDASATSSDESNSSASSDSDVDAEGSFAAAADSAA